MHVLDAVLVHTSLCNFMERTVAMVKVWFINMLSFSKHFHKCLIGFLVSGCMNHAVARGFVQHFLSYRGHFHAE